MRRLNSRFERRVLAVTTGCLISQQCLNMLKHSPCLSVASVGLASVCCIGRSHIRPSHLSVLCPSVTSVGLASICGTSVGLASIRCIHPSCIHPSCVRPSVTSARHICRSCVLPPGTTRHHLAPPGTARHHPAPPGTTRHHPAPPAPPGFPGFPGFPGTTRHHPEAVTVL